MSYFDDASLVMIPSGYKDQKVYSVKPLDGSGDLTFSRASGATRVASNGLIEKVRTNLATYSEQLNNSSGWGFEQLGVTANAVANPLDGAVTADKIYATVTGSSVPILKQYTAATANQTIVVSGYFKKVEYDYVIIHGFGLGGTVFNLAAGTKSGDGTITSVGNGWYRCSAILAMSGDARVFITPSVDGNVGYTSTANSGVYAFGMQFELGDVATAYIATTSAAVSVGPVSGLPRLDYLGSTCPRLLLEPQRTNLATYSEQANIYTKVGATIGSNVATSPDGYTNADSIIEDGSNGPHAFYNFGLTTFTAAAYTASVFAKKGTRNWLSLSLYDGTTDKQAFFNLNTGAAGSVSAGATSTITNYGNGWYRCTITSTAATTSGGIAIYAANTDGSASYAGTNGATAIYAYGWQLELGAYATSYVNTLGSSVTRVADTASKTGISSLIGQTEGTLFIDLSDVNDLDFPEITIDNNNNTDRIVLTRASNGNWGIFVASSAAATYSVYSTTSSTSGKFALAYSSAGYALYRNGVQIVTGTYNLPVALSAIRLNGRSSSDFFATKKVAQAVLFKTRLSNSDLAALTA